MCLAQHVQQLHGGWDVEHRQALAVAVAGGVPVGLHGQGVAAGPLAEQYGADLQRGAQMQRGGQPGPQLRWWGFGQQQHRRHGRVVRVGGAHAGQVAGLVLLQQSAPLDEELLDPHQGLGQGGGHDQPGHRTDGDGLRAEQRRQRVGGDHDLAAGVRVVRAPGRQGRHQQCPPGRLRTRADQAQPASGNPAGQAGQVDAARSDRRQVQLLVAVGVLGDGGLPRRWWVQQLGGLLAHGPAQPGHHRWQCAQVRIVQAQLGRGWAGDVAAAPAQPDHRGGGDQRRGQGQGDPPAGQLHTDPAVRGAVGRGVGARGGGCVAGGGRRGRGRTRAGLADDPVGVLVRR